MDPSSVLVIADAPALARRLRRVLDDREWHVHGPVDGPGVAGAIGAVSPNLIVVDLDRSDGGGLEMLARVWGLDPDARVAGYGAVSREREAAALLEGACGVIAATDDDGSVGRALGRAASGELLIGPERLAELVAFGRGVAPARPSGSTSLTPRERQVLRLLSEGLTTGAVAERLGISVATVRSHVQRILGKLDVHSTMEAVRFAWREGVAAVPAGG